MWSDNENTQLKMSLTSSKVDRSAFSVTPVDEKSAEDDRYWHAKTPEERLAALEQLRQIAYGYDPATEQLQRILEVVKRS